MESLSESISILGRVYWSKNEGSVLKQRFEEHPGLASYFPVWVCFVFLKSNVEASESNVVVLHLEYDWSKVAIPSVAVKKQLLRTFGPEKILLIDQLFKTAQSVVWNNSFFCGALAAKFGLRKCDISSTSEREFPDFWVNFWLLNSLQRGVLVHKNSLASLSMLVAASSHALWRVLSNKAIWECLVTAELTPHTYIVLRETLFCPVFLLALHRHGHAETWLWLYRSASLKRFLLNSTQSRRRTSMILCIHTSECIRTWQSSTTLLRL